MADCSQLFYLCLAGYGIILVLFAMTLNYNLKMSAKQVRLEKEIHEVERVNGKEKRDIKELQQKIQELERKLTEK